MRNSKYYIIPILIVLSVSFISCSSSRNSVPQEKKDDSPKKVLPPAPVPLSPGVARVMAIPLLYNQEDQMQICTLKIEQVTGYGMSTPVLTVGSEVQVQMDMNLDQQQREQFISAKQEARPITMTLQSLAGGITESKAPIWKIVQIGSRPGKN